MSDSAVVALILTGGAYVTSMGGLFSSTRRWRTALVGLAFTMLAGAAVLVVTSAPPPGACTWKDPGGDDGVPSLQLTTR